MVIEGALKEKLEALKFKPVSRRTGKPLVGGSSAPEKAPAAAGTSVPAAAFVPEPPGRPAPPSGYTRSDTAPLPSTSLPHRPAPPSGYTRSDTTPLPSTSLPERPAPSVHVSVRCRPPTDPNAQLFHLTSEPLGSDKVILRLSASEPSSASSAENSKDSRMFRCHTYLSSESSIEDLSALATPVVQHVMDGGNGSILCHGITGSGKSYAMLGSGQESGGIVHSVAKHVFEYMARSSSGKVYLMEASYLQIFSPDGATEKLVDLLADVDKQLEVKQDSANSQAFMCEGLRRVPIKAPSDVGEVISKGRQRSSALESEKGFAASRSHCVFVLTTESLAEGSGSGEPLVSRGKLLLVDLAGSESLMKAVSSSSDDLARRQAMSIDRTFASLSMAVNGSSAGMKGFYVTQLLKDCLGGSARALLVATIGPELEELEETAKTLTFAQQMMTSIAVRSSAGANARVDQDHSSLRQMRDRHSECIRKLQEKVSDSREEEVEERRRLQQEMQQINDRLLTKESAVNAMDDLSRKHDSKIDDMRREITQVMSRQMEEAKRHSQEELDRLKQSVEKSSQESERAKRDAEAQEAQIAKLQANLHAAQEGRQAAEAEVSALKVRLATAEERSTMLQTRQEELRRERQDYDEERKGLRQQGEQQWQRLALVEAELAKLKPETEGQRTEISRLAAARAEESENLRKEREHWRDREAQLQNEVRDVRQEFDSLKRETELEALKQENKHKEELAKLKQQMERLEGEVSIRNEQLSDAQKTVASLEAERAMAQHREDQMRQQQKEEQMRWQEEMQDAKEREEELMRMLSEVQDSIIAAENAGTVSESLGVAALRNLQQ